MRQSLQKLNIRFLALVMAVMLLLCAVPTVSAAHDSGTCGKNLEWTLNGDTLTITGSGAMADYSENSKAPWYSYRREIARVQLPEGLTSIGDLAFYECSALEFVSIPTSVTEIGWHAFSDCTAMKMLSLSSGLKKMEAGAFRDCTALLAVRLPESLTELGDKAFYRCESLTEITIPSSAKKLGLSVFSYCYNLLRAEIQSPITSIPSAMFYGCSRLTDIILPSTLQSVEQYTFYDCDNLTDVVYNGSEESKKQILEDIKREQEGKPSDTQIVDQPGETPTNNTVYDGDGNGNPGSNTTTTTETENASVSYTVTVTYLGENAGRQKVHVNVTLETASAWSEVADTVTEVVNNADETAVDVYIKDTTALANDVLDDLMGKKVVVTIRNASGAVWSVDCYRTGENRKKDVQNSTKDKNDKPTLDLSYERLDATAEQLELLGCAVGYQIKFLSDAQVDVEVMIKLPVENARKNASLYQITKSDSKELLQTTVVDNAGYAHFFLASVDAETVYLIGIDVPDVPAEEAIIPEVLHQDYGITEQLTTTEYVITGRQSTWGMDIKQVTLIMVGVMVSAVIVVGFLMFALNKRKLKRGYVPDLEDEDL